MGETTKISWTDSTWSPVTGCTKVSEGCRSCYAEAISKRFGRDFSVQAHPERLDIPLHWRKSRRIFVCSVSDLFHEDVPFDFIDRVFKTMVLARQHTFQCLTKRPERMLEYLTSLEADLDAWPLPVEKGNSRIVLTSLMKGLSTLWPLSNVWLGVSVESAKYLPRLDVLSKVPAKVRFVSCEPLLEPLDLRKWLTNPHTCICSMPKGLHTPKCTENSLSWVIIGGESGLGHRPMQVEWVEDIANQCKAAGVPLFVKQASSLRPGQQGDLPDSLWALKQMPQARR
jgi:protein gp37